jgi:hypothetical protein
MPIIRFAGRVLPTFIELTIRDHPEINWRESEADLDMTFQISIQNGRITVECALNRFEQTQHLIPVYMRAFDLVRATVDVSAFATGYGLSVIIDSFTDASGVTTPFVAHDPTIAGLCTAFTLEPASTLQANTFHHVLTIVLGDWRIFRTLRDLIEAITLPHESAVNCARAVEGLRNIIAPDAPRAQAWRQMRDTLNLSESYLKLVTDISTGPRHGDHAHIPGATTVEITRRAWVIMNRFLEFKKRGDRSPPLSDFPILTA